MCGCMLQISFVIKNLFFFFYLFVHLSISLRLSLLLFILLFYPWLYFFLSFASYSFARQHRCSAHPFGNKMSCMCICVYTNIHKRVTSHPQIFCCVIPFDICFILFFIFTQIIFYMNNFISIHYSSLYVDKYLIHESIHIM